MTGSTRTRAAVVGFACISMIVGGLPVGGDEATTSDVDDLVAWMTGTFSNAVQASEDPDVLAVNLHVAPVWHDRDDGRWLYLEQAVADHDDRPYRQRVLRVSEIVDGLFEIAIHTLPDPPEAVGAWQREAPLSELEPTDLEPREGCSVLLRRRGSSFVGSTLASLCPSSLAGADYATSEVLVTPDGMVSRDRGFADDGRQVWGPNGPGYVFDRIVEELPVDADNAATSEPESESDSASQDPDGGDG